MDFKTWAGITAGCLLLAVMLVLLYVLYQYLLIFGLILLALVVLALCIGVGFLPMLLLTLLRRLQLSNIGQYGTMIRQGKSVEVIQPTIPQPMEQHRSIVPAQSREVTVRHVNVGSVISQLPSPEPEPEEPPPDNHDETTIPLDDSNVVPLYDNFDRAYEAWNAGYNTQGKLAKYLQISNKEAKELIERIKGKRTA